MSCNRSKSILGGVLGGPGTPDCIQLTTGQPTEPPDECNLPVQFDQDTSVLWIYDCTNEEWLSISDICSYRLADRNEIGDETTFTITACLDGEPVQIPEFELCSVPTVNTSWFNTSDPDNAYQIVCSPNTVGNEKGLIRVPFVKPFEICELPEIDQPSVDAGTSVQTPVCIDGDQRLAPYVGPYSVCTLDSIDQTAVDNATTIEIAACVDGVEQLVPYVPPYEYSVCTLDSIDQTAVDNATTVELAACVDGVENLIPYLHPCNSLEYQNSFVNTQTSYNLVCMDGFGMVKTPYNPPICLYDSIDQTAVDNATTVELAACVDGVEQLVPYVPPYEYSVCTLDSIDQTAVDNATTVELAACVDGVEQLVPYVPPYEYSVCALSDSLDAEDELPSMRFAVCNNGVDETVYGLEIINYIQANNFFSPNLCNLTTIDQTGINAASTIEVAACVDGNQQNIPPNQIIKSDSTWVVEPYGSTTPGTFVHTGDSPQGNYIELGERVWFNIYIDGSWSPSFTGELRIPLPFTSDGTRKYVIKDVTHLDVIADSNILAIINGGDNYLTLHKYGTNGVTTPITDADQISTGNEIIINGFYIKA